tara:strand:- start:4517 stop:5446 length:930 start_codon:yes stop_codon:yes gene_type:complete
MANTNYKLPHEAERRKDILTGNKDLDDERIHINKNRHENQPRVARTENDYIIENRHNASIVLGRDYEYDDLNDTSIGMVDISAGRTGNMDDGERSGGSLISDAAKIYISQKTDIDRLYGFTPKKSSTSRSAIGIKADAVRVISRDPSAGIKLIVQPDSFGSTAGKNSQGGSATGVQGGVEILGPGKEISQPMVKSDDLAKSLAKLVNYIEQIEIMVWDFVSYQKKFNSAVSQATDIEAFYAQKGIPDPLLLKAKARNSLDLFSYVESSGRSIRSKLEKYKTNDLGVDADGEKAVKTSKAVFSSKYHKLN